LRGSLFGLAADFYLIEEREVPMLRTLKFSIFVSAIAAAAPAFGSTVAAIEGQANNTPATIDGSGDSAVITNILSQPGSGDGYTYTNWSFLVNDGTGSLDVFGHLPTGSTYTPTVGDAITAQGTYSPFDSIPEVGTLTSISANSNGNPVPSPVVTTVPTLSAITPTSYNLLGEYLEVDNAYFTGTTATTFPTHANLNFTLSDGGTGANDSVTGFYWPSSYSSDDVYAGTTIPTGPVNVQGFVDIFSGAAEFVPISITAVPEPASVGLVATGALFMLTRRRRKA
jgi:PEP-CTERM motif